MADTGLLKNLKLKNVMIAVVGAFFLIQIVSLLLNQISPSIPLLKGGNVFLLMLVAVAFISLFVLSMDIKILDDKANLTFIVIVFGLVVAGFYFLPKYFPQLFVLSPEINIAVRQTIASIFGGS